MARAHGALRTQEGARKRDGRDEQTNEDLALTLEGCETKTKKDLREKVDAHNRILRLEYFQAFRLRRLMRDRRSGSYMARRNGRDLVERRCGPICTKTGEFHNPHSRGALVTIMNVGSRGGSGEKNEFSQPHTTNPTEKRE